MKEVKEGNVLIALFMGAKKENWYPANKDNKQTGDYYAFEEKEYPANEKYVGDYALKYHCSYDWLMPVWFKAMLWYRAEFGALTSTFDINNMGIYISANHSSAFKYAYLFTREISQKQILNAIYESMVYFVEWYNAQNKESL